MIYDYSVHHLSLFDIAIMFNTVPDTFQNLNSSDSKTVAVYIHYSLLNLTLFRLPHLFFDNL